MNASLVKIWRKALLDIGPERLAGRWRELSGSALDRDYGLLCWGKAGLPTWEALKRKLSPSAALVIAPSYSHASNRVSVPARLVRGDHPIPGDGSMEAGVALLEFFQFLARSETKKLFVFLSGGASSLAWLPSSQYSRKWLQHELKDLYRAPLTIKQLNKERRKLCALKAGGAAFWLRKFTPNISVSVGVISDVLPYGVEVVGSGPFFDGKIRHEVLADNSMLLKKISEIFAAYGVKTLFRRSGIVEDLQAWVTLIEKQVGRFIKAEMDGVLLFGGEPKICVPSKAGKGGRQTHIAAVLLLTYWDLIKKGRVEILTGSSDGVDGASGGSGVFLSRSLFGQESVLTEGNLKNAIKRFDTASWFESVRSLLPSFESVTNVQDVVLIRVIAS